MLIARRLEKGDGQGAGRVGGTDENLPADGAHQHDCRAFALQIGTAGAETIGLMRARPAFSSANGFPLRRTMLYAMPRGRATLHKRRAHPATAAGGLRVLP